MGIVDWDSWIWIEDWMEVKSIKSLIHNPHLINFLILILLNLKNKIIKNEPIVFFLKVLFNQIIKNFQQDPDLI